MLGLQLDEGLSRNGIPAGIARIKVLRLEGAQSTCSTEAGAACLWGGERRM